MAFFYIRFGLSYSFIKKIDLLTWIILSPFFYGLILLCIKTLLFFFFFQKGKSLVVENALIFSPLIIYTCVYRAYHIYVRINTCAMRA